MEKEALLKIIIQDINELETLLNTFTGKPEIPKTFINLSKSKVKGILEELDLLENLCETSHREVVAEKKQESNQPIILPPPAFDIQLKAEPKELPKEEKKELIAETTPPSYKVEPDVIEIEKVIELKTEDTTIVKQPPKKADSSKTSQSAVLGEKLGRDTPSYNESIANKIETESTSRFQSKPIDDLRKGIGINDRFFFTRELFNSNAELMNQTLDQLNNMKDLKSAEAFLETNFSWESNNEAVKPFKDLVKRRFL